MVKLLPLHDREVLAELNRRAGVDAGLSYCLYDGGEITGYLLYDLVAGEGFIKAVSAPDEDSFDGLVRAVFASLYDAQVNRARFAPEVDGQTLIRLGFVQPGSDCTDSIEDILYRCKHCQSANGNS